MVLKKRIFDLIFTLVTLPIWGMIVLLGSMLVKIFSEGDIFFMQNRVGKDGRIFRVIKFRTMVPNAENMGAGIYSEDDDPRFTKIGLFLRRTSIDEIPQFINILKGEMSVVGPRPMLSVIVDEYLEQYEQILKVNPGITGLAQISGRNELLRSKRLAYDIEYVKSWNIRMDLAILAKTIAVVVTGEGQRNDQSQSDVEK
jgi:lipopolysaccharide/colanic/teichoic acid biosynthesis glycosyltransferase